MDGEPSTYFRIPLAKKSSGSRGRGTQVTEGGGGATCKSLQPDGSTHNAYERHLKRVKDYVHYYNDGLPVQELPEWKETANLTELDILKTNQRFLRDEGENEEQLTWEERVARKYYDELYKEYCIADLSRYRKGMVALRWRTKEEVTSGKGECICASTKCGVTDRLKSWEVAFGYVEGGEKKSALVKVRMCKRCFHKLNYGRSKGAALRRAKSPNGAGECGTLKGTANGGSPHVDRP